jgi:hypothetical protein
MIYNRSIYASELQDLVEMNPCSPSDGARNLRKTTKIIGYVITMIHIDIATLLANSSYVPSVPCSQDGPP